jgi:hypothetical protein
MRKLVTCAALMLALTACNDSKLTDVVVDEAQNLPVRATWLSTLGAIGPAPQAAGTLKLDEYGSYMLLETSLQGLHVDSTYQWRLFFGTCAARISNFGPNANPPAYRPFIAGPGGAARSEATVAGRLKADSAYHVRVFIPRTAPVVDTTFYACGDLRRS